MTDIVERLRNMSSIDYTELNNEAADEIERLLAKLAEYAAIAQQLEKDARKIEVLMPQLCSCTIWNRIADQVAAAVEARGKP